MSLNKHSTALIIIDLQEGITTDDRAPYSSEQIIAINKTLADRFREAGAPVVLVKVAFSADEAPSRKVSSPSLPEQSPEGFDTLVEGLQQPQDIVVTKHHWGAFIGTDLDLQLRRRGIDTVVISGIATNFGVESTARSAWELSYNVVIPEDACTSFSAEYHRFSIDHILKRIAVVNGSDDIRFN
ncbi:hydrolase [Carnimonas bestiolae]|uniref:hydrolase n=1 Tax=Carnimonas bestiolae TaxID=3402172 RepID=UPI003EDBC5F1